MTLTQSVLILYGTQTGTSQEVGERLSRQLQRNHIPNRVLSIDQYDKTQLIRESCCLFIVATTGQGEIPYSMKEFWKFLLRKNLPQDILSQLKFSVFGLGDSSYEFFNVVGKKLYKRVLQLGASPIFPFGSGDDQHYLGYDGGLKGWSEGVLEVLKDIYPTNKAPLQTENCLEPSWKLNPIANESLSDTQNHMIMDDNPGWISMKVIKNCRITPNDHFQESRDLILEFNDPTTKILPGDIASFYPQNLPDMVNKFIELNGYEDIADQLYDIKPTSQDIFVPVYLRSPKTLRQLLTNYIDFNSIPKYTFFEFIYHFTDDEMLKEKILEWLTPEGMDDRLAYTLRVKRTIPEVLTDFRMKIPLNYLLDTLPSLKPRSFSIANYSGAQPNQLQLAIGVIHYKTKMSTIRTGVCTQWVSKSLGVNDELYVRLMQGSLKPPSDPNMPVIMISPGLGVAPFRGLIQYRVQQNATSNYLYFGSRHPDKDQYYKEEFSQLETEGKLVYRTGFSRYEGQKVYVQHLLEKDTQLIQELVIEKGGHIYLCGSSNNMPKQVEAALVKIFDSYEKEEINGKLFFGQLKKEKRFWLESWS